jgi:hypothetical protein
MQMLDHEMMCDTGMSEFQTSKRGLAPVLPIATICSNLTPAGYCECGICALVHNPEFCTIRHRCIQISFLAGDVTTTRDHAVSVTYLATIFDVNRRSVERNLSHGPEDSAMAGGNPGLGDDRVLILASTVSPQRFADESLKNNHWNKRVPGCGDTG